MFKSENSIKLRRKATFMGQESQCRFWTTFGELLCVKSWSHWNVVEPKVISKNHNHFTFGEGFELVTPTFGETVLLRCYNAKCFVIDNVFWLMSGKFRCCRDPGSFRDLLVWTVSHQLKSCWTQDAAHPAQRRVPDVCRPARNGPRPQKPGPERPRLQAALLLLRPRLQRWWQVLRLLGLFRVQQLPNGRTHWSHLQPGLQSWRVRHLLLGFEAAKKTLPYLFKQHWFEMEKITMILIYLSLALPYSLTWLWSLIWNLLSLEPLK